MVKPLRPAKFYGGSLPRPRIYTDLKFNSARIDPPPSVLESLLRWAKDARWSKGGLCAERKRTRGKIEGAAKNIRAEDEEKSMNPKEEDQSMEENTANGASAGHESTATAEFHGDAAAEEDLAESKPKPSPRKRSPRVPRRSWKFGELLGFLQAPRRKGALQLHRKPSHELKVFDFIPVPDKIIPPPARRISPRKGNIHVALGFMGDRGGGFSSAMVLPEVCVAS